MKRAFAVSLILALLSSVLAGTLSYRHGFSDFVAYGETEVYGTDASVTVTIVSPKGTAFNNVTLAIEIQAPEGYSLEYHGVLFQEYLFAAALIDCDRAEVISVLDVDYHGDRSQIFFFNGSVKIPLSYSNGVYHGETVLPFLPAGLHSVTVWVRAEQNMMSFFPFLWTALSDTVTFTVIEPLPQTVAAVAEPPVINMFSPENESYAVNDVVISFNVSIGQLNETFGQITGVVDLTEVYFVGDWQQINSYVLHDAIAKTVGFSGNLTDVPEGSHSVMVVASERVPDPSLPPYLFYFSTSSLSINFTVDTIRPRVSLLSPETRIYNVSDVSLDFTIDESFSQLVCSLDGGDNVSIAGNTTLSGLASGAHNITVYAWDEAGNIGTSETVTFTVAAAQFPTTLFAVAVIASAAIIAFGLVAYFLRRKKRRSTA
jgi:hypothetical protein